MNRRKSVKTPQVASDEQKRFLSTLIEACASKGAGWYLE
jgi:hypothetical protein